MFFWGVLRKETNGGINGGVEDETRRAKYMSREGAKFGSKKRMHAWMVPRERSCAIVLLQAIFVIINFSLIFLFLIHGGEFFHKTAQRLLSNILHGGFD